MKTSAFTGIFIFMALRLVAQDPQNMKVENQVLDCGKLKSMFGSLKEAKETLSNTIFAFKQELKTTKRSGVKEVHYFTCDNESGFLQIKIDERELVYKDYPRFQWKLLIETNDLDEFYEKNVKGKYIVVASGSSN